MRSRALVALVTVVLAASCATCAGDAPSPPLPLRAGNDVLVLFEMWRNKWRAGVARDKFAGSVAAAASSSTESQNPLVDEEKDASRSPQEEAPAPAASLSDVVATVTRNDTAAGRHGGHFLRSQLGACVVDVTKLRLDASAFEASCPTRKAKNTSTSAEDDNNNDYDSFASCGANCGCELGRRLRLAGYPVIGPDAVDVKVWLFFSFDESGESVLVLVYLYKKELLQPLDQSLLVSPKKMIYERALRIFI